MISQSRFLLGIGVGAEYPCGSVAASEQSEDDGVAKDAQHRWFALATSKHLLPAYDLLLRLLVRHHDRLWIRCRFLRSFGLCMDVRSASHFL